MARGIERARVTAVGENESADGVGTYGVTGTEPLYTTVAPATTTQMLDSLYRAGVFTVYQLTLVVGILLMPFALMAGRLGVPMPVGDLVSAAGRVYERTA